VIFRDIIPPKKTLSPEKREVISLTLIVPEKPDRQTERLRGLMFMLGGATLIILLLNLIHLNSRGLRLKQNIADAAASGFENIVNGAFAIERAHFENATELFRQAELTFGQISHAAWFTAPKIPTLSLRDPVFDATEALITAGNSLAAAGALFTDVAKNLQFLTQDFFAGNEKPASQTRVSLTEKLKKEFPKITNAAAFLEKANEAMQKVPASFIPRELKDRFRFAVNALTELTGFMKSLESDIPAMLALLGDSEPHTFLILLQNNAELRPSGGFIGNYAILETNDGYLAKTEVFDVYSADHQLTEVIAPPPEILPVNKRWFLRDSNYSGHFPLSAAKAAWFLEKERGPGVDSVIAIDQTFVSELLRLTGPIKIPELSQSVTSENFDVIFSYIIEAKISGRENPKAVLKSFVPALERAILKYADPVALPSLLRNAISGKHLLGFSKDPMVQEFFQRHGMSGEMKILEPKEDYLAVVHTSIGGNKSDAYMDETINHDTFLKSDGRLIDEVTITRAHRWDDKTEAAMARLISSFGFSQISREVLAILGASRNLHMLRIYVPAGAILEESSGAEVNTDFDSETGKTFFHAQMEVPPNGARTLRIRYRLPFTLNLDPVDKYALTVQKQAGQNRVALQKRIFPDSRVQNYKYFPEEGNFDMDGVWSVEAELASDVEMVSVWGK
jgi:hypothetical protein